MGIGQRGFQFTHPGKGATLAEMLADVDMMFQFTHPGKGATSRRNRSCSCWCCFNSRTLGRVRLALKTKEVVVEEFQFTHPGKGATKIINDKSRTPRVSIHAPWEGCDRLRQMTPIEIDLMFQFTHPGKGATGVVPSELYGTEFQFTHPGKGATLRRTHRQGV